METNAIVLLEGDETGQELLEEALRVLGTKTRSSTRPHGRYVSTDWV
jgi:isocitrate/isopropylmalate dehydrogenase